MAEHRIGILRTCLTQPLALNFPLQITRVQYAQYVTMHITMHFGMLGHTSHDIISQQPQHKLACNRLHSFLSHLSRVFIFCDLCFPPDSSFCCYYYQTVLLQSTASLCQLFFLLLFSVFVDVSEETCFSMFRPGPSLRLKMLFAST